MRIVQGTIKLATCWHEVQCACLYGLFVKVIAGASYERWLASDMKAEGLDMGRRSTTSCP